jgi:replicative DNA helicase
MRALCSEARIDSRIYRSGYLKDDDWGRLSDAHSILAPLPLAVDDTPRISVPTMKAKAMRYAAENGGLDFIVVDYLGLMADTAKSLYEQATNISRDLKGLAKELKLPLAALCQLNRGPENRTDHRPTLSDLRESGALEQDADQVAFIYRQDKYRPANEPKDNVGEVIVAKNRNGPCDIAYLRWEESFTRFDNMSKGERNGRPSS